MIYRILYFLEIDRIQPITLLTTFCIYKGINSFDKLITFLDELNSRKINFDLEYNRTGYVMVCVAVPGERWEVEFDSGRSI